MTTQLELPQHISAKDMREIRKAGKAEGWTFEIAYMIESLDPAMRGTDQDRAIRKSVQDKAEAGSKVHQLAIEIEATCAEAELSWRPIASNKIKMIDQTSVTEGWRLRDMHLFRALDRYPTIDPKVEEKHWADLMDSIIDKAESGSKIHQLAWHWYEKNNEALAPRAI
jgi:hypothetical protein